MRTTIFRSSGWMLCLAGALVAPAMLPAQQADTAATRTHVVRAGETLWMIAQRYLGDGGRWREILQLNASVIRGPQDVPVGATLRIPGSGARPAGQPAPAARGAGAPPARRSDPPPSQAAAPAAGASGRTIFFGRRNAGGLTMPAGTSASSGDTMAYAAAVRAFEVASAPFVADSATLAAAGRCERPGRAADVMRSGVSLSERLMVTPPRGAPVDSAARYVLARRGPQLEVGPVVVPTAVVRLVGDRPATAPLQAEIVAQFDAVACGDMVLPLELPAHDARRPAPVTNGAEGRVVWVASEAVLPTLQHYVVIDIGAGSGLRAGDQVSIYAGSGRRAPAAIAAVVRVGARSATVLVINQASVAIGPGAAVRVSAKLP